MLCIHTPYSPTTVYTVTYIVIYKRTSNTVCTVQYIIFLFQCTVHVHVVLYLTK